MLLWHENRDAETNYIFREEWTLKKGFKKGFKGFGWNIAFRSRVVENNDKQIRNMYIFFKCNSSF